MCVGVGVGGVCGCGCGRCVWVWVWAVAQTVPREQDVQIDICGTDCSVNARLLFLLSAVPAFIFLSLIHSLSLSSSLYVILYAILFVTLT